jgi:hypothetical protein
VGETEKIIMHGHKTTKTMNRRLFIFAGLMVLLFMFSACKTEEQIPSVSPEVSPSPAQETSTPSPSQSVSAEPSAFPADGDAAKVEDNALEKQYALEGVNENIKGDLYVSVPEITSEDYPENAAMINDYFENLKEKYRDGFESELNDLSTDENVTGPAASGRFLDVSFQTEYNRNGIISFFITEGSYQGGAHDSTAIKSETFDLRNGVRIAADNLFTVEESEYTRLIKDYIIREMDRNAQKEEMPYFENYKELVESTYNKEAFVLTENGLRVYFQIYDLAPYVAGPIQFEIPYDYLKDFLNPEYGIQ